MNDALVRALENRIELGETKEALQKEVLAAGHAPEVFESAYRMAYIQVEEKKAEAAMSEETQEATESVTEPAAESAVTKETATASERPASTDTADEPAPKSEASAAPSSDIVGIIAMVEAGWNMATSNLRILGGAMIFVLVSMIVLGVLTVALGGISLGLLAEGDTAAMAVVMFFVFVYLLAVAIGVLTRYATTRALLQRDGEVRYAGHVGWGLGMLAPIFMLMLYYGTLSFIGSLLLLVPGVIAGIYFSQAGKLIAAENKTALEAMVRSVELTYGSFWKVFWRLFVISAVVGIASAAVTSITSVSTWGPVLAIPVQAFLAFWGLATGVVLFESLQARQPAERFSAAAKKKLRIFIRIATIIGTALMAVAVVMVLFFAATSVEFEEALTNPEALLPTQVEEIQNQELATEQSNKAAAIKQNLNTVRTQAQNYWAENLSYAGVCSDPLAAYDLISRTYDLEVGNVHCEDSTEWFIVEAELPDGDYYCIDSLATAKVNAQSRKGQESCF